MDLALWKRDADSGVIEKCVNAVTEFTPHPAAVHGRTEAHPKVQAEHERMVAEILQQDIRCRVFEDVRMFGRRLTDDFGDGSWGCSVSDTHRHYIAHQIITQGPVNNFLFEELTV